ncbi:signal peptidase I [Kingella kingae]|uniref:signal peptidase I n=1 Tax=Kingella kingae TaxID=504 RepID=UPI00030AB7E7|nr:signal peptidase I [Kingella kingae]MDK4555572.1 signal peptidase I [Kingella kingae]MDK4584825.1 signal peptidase I [Kingella kingae]MDK4588643.1 signal peptidase I [Kingella kingae]MDK4597053.1 signal peptidase I [Kingella kingae]MDK4600830.1 signal peptidase I [Kingella kingae]
MEFNQISYAAIGIICVGAIMLFSSSKQRTAENEWSNTLQWGYLLMMMGIFGLLSFSLAWSFTAVLLLFTLITSATWLWKKISHKNKDIPDNNHFRDYMAGFFPIIAIVFVLRTFVAEPFQIPSSSMRPGLVKGDFILVNKFAYGIRIPVINSVLIPTGQVQRGDVAVFTYPVDTKLNYIKRIVGVAGDVIEYKDKVLTVNGEVQTTIPASASNYVYPDDREPMIQREASQFNTQFFGHEFAILQENNMPSVDAGTWNNYQDLMHKQNFTSGLEQHCTYEADGSGFKCTVPEGKYFAMGDNRDASADSRYWGFVDDKLMVGKAFLIWLNPTDLSRIGHMID